MLENHKGDQTKTKHYMLKKAIEPGSISTLIIIKNRTYKGKEEDIIYKPQTG